MTDTTRLGLPLIEAAQAQKHVTHNEGLARLDALVHLSVNGRAAAPPTTIPAAARYLVSGGASGAFASHTNEIAVFQDASWIFLVPKAGWRAFMQDDGSILVFDGSAWRDLGASIRTLDQLARLGLGTSADATNPLAVKVNNALFSALASSEGGTGDLRCKLNKEASGKTVSHLFQTNWSGRAEAGLMGSDHYQVKVSPDGANWKVALDIDPGSGAVGIGTTTPAAGLTTVVGGNFAACFRSTNTSLYSPGGILVGGPASLGANAQCGLYVVNTNDGGTNGAFNIAKFSDAGIWQQIMAAYDFVGDYWTLASAGQERLRIDSSGRVGIGTSLPGRSLEVFASGSNVSARIGNALGNLDVGGSDGGSVFIDSRLWKMGLQTGGVTRVTVDGSGNVGIGTTTPGDRLTVAGVVRPAADNAYALGASGFRWSSVYAATGTINTSDEREKSDISDLPEVLPLLRRLRPVSYRWKVGGVEMATCEVTETMQEQATEEVVHTREEVDVADGSAVLRIRSVSEVRPLFDEVPVFDEAGAPVFDEVPELDEAGAPLKDQNGRPCITRKQRTVQVPRICEVQRKRTEQHPVERPGRRVHLGLIAQEVKAVADALGIDFAAYVYDADSDRHGLRYDQMIAPLIKGVQELDAALGALTARVAALESKAS